uniref:Uncharacterized protein n=1 Tax=Suricata suricatta TaxID=37032 RepID=A0A673T5C1_SURSU
GWVSGQRALKLLESIFHRGHERFRIASACLDELSCEFLLAGVSPSRGPVLIALSALFPQESYPAVPPIWSVESDDPNLAAVLERLVDIKKGNTLVRGRAAGPRARGPCPGDLCELVTCLGGG